LRISIELDFEIKLNPICPTFCFPNKNLLSESSIAFSSRIHSFLLAIIFAEDFSSKTFSSF